MVFERLDSGNPDFNHVPELETDIEEFIEEHKRMYGDDIVAAFSPEYSSDEINEALTNMAENPRVPVDRYSWAGKIAYKMRNVGPI